MIEETEIGSQTLDSSSEAIELAFRQEPKLETPGNETSGDELTLRSVDDRIKRATSPIIRGVDEIYFLLAGLTDMEIPLRTVKRPVRNASMSLLAPHVTGTTAIIFGVVEKPHSWFVEKKVDRFACLLSRVLCGLDGIVSQV